MTRQEKIKEIMTLAGVGPRDFDKASRNYEALANDEIDRRWSKLRHGAAAVDAWRATGGAVRPAQNVAVDTDVVPSLAQHPPEHSRAETQRQTVGATASTGMGWPRRDEAAISEIYPTPLLAHRLVEDWLGAIERSNASIDRNIMAFTKLMERVRRWRSPVRDMVAAEINAQVAHLAIAAESSRSTNKLLAEIAAATAAGLDTDDFETIVSGHIRKIVAKNEHLAALTGLASRRVAQVAGILHPLMPDDDPRLTATATVDAFARLENAVSGYRPDIIVTVNEEGESVGKVVVSHLNLNIPVLKVRGSAKAGLIWDEFAGLKLDLSPVVCVIGHVTQTGRTMAETIEVARQRYGTPNVFGIVLASTWDAAEEVHKHGPFFFHQIAEASMIEVSYDATKDTKIGANEFILGAESGDVDKILAVPRAMLDRARKDMIRAYPIAPLLWETPKI